MAKKQKQKVPAKLGSKWRVTATGVNLESPGNEIVMDEIYIEDVLHLEMMSTTSYWMRVGDHVLNVWRKNGKTYVTHEVDGV
jgi:hypothetical protein